MQPACPTQLTILMPRRKNSAGWISVPPRETPSTITVPTNLPKSDVDLDDVDTALADLMKDDQLSLDGKDDIVKESDALTMNRELVQSSVKLKQLLKAGKLVGEKGRPSQVLQDARIFHQINQMAVPVIRKIRISRCVWNSNSSRKFTKLLISQLARQCHDPEDLANDGDHTHLSMASSHFSTTFVEEYLKDCISGYVPDIAPVYAASLHNDKVIAKKTTQKSFSQRRATQLPSQHSALQGTKQNESRQLPMTQSLDAVRLMPTQAPSLEVTNQDADRLYARIENEYLRQGRESICLMRMLIDTMSFQKSVANFFVFSHLLQDGRVSMNIGPTGLPVCLPMRAFGKRVTPEMFDGERNGEDDMDRDRCAGQTVMLQLNVRDWRELVRLLAIPKRAMIVEGSLEC